MLAEKIQKTSNKPSNKSLNISLVKLKIDGMPAWHYVDVSRTKQPLLKKIEQGVEIDVANLGEILFSGWGETPPLAIRKKVKELQS